MHKATITVLCLRCMNDLGLLYPSNAKRKTTLLQFSTFRALLGSLCLVVSCVCKHGNLNNNLSLINQFSQLFLMHSITETLCVYLLMKESIKLFFI